MLIGVAVMPRKQLVFQKCYFLFGILYDNHCSEGFLIGEKIALKLRTRVLIASTNNLSCLFASFGFSLLQVKRDAFRSFLSQ